MGAAIQTVPDESVAATVSGERSDAFRLFVPMGEKQDILGQRPVWSNTSPGREGHTQVHGDQEIIELSQLLSGRILIDDGRIIGIFFAL